MTAHDPPIACTLAAEDFRDRLAWIAALTRDALRGYSRDDLVLNLRYAPEAASRVRELMLKEQVCCGFLAFEMYQHPDEVRLTIRRPIAYSGATIRSALRGAKVKFKGVGARALAE